MMSELDRQILVTRARLNKLLKMYRFQRQLLGAVSSGKVLFPTRGQVFRVMNRIRARILSLMLKQRIDLLESEREKAWLLHDL